MKKLNILLLILPGLYYAQLSTPQGQIQATVNPETGNIGIGTTRPEAKLNVTGMHGDTTILLKSSGNGSDVPAYLNLWASEPTLTYNGVGIGNNVRFFNPQTNTPGLSRFVENFGGSYIRLLDNSINFNLINSSGQAKTAVNIVDNGNMAIGTHIPSTKLEVYNEASMGHLTLSGNDNGASDYSRIDLDYKIKSTGHVVGRVSSFYLDSGNGGSGGLRFFTRDAGQLKEKMWIAANGNVSISNKLEAKEIKVTNSPTADFVFEDTYQLPKLENVEKHIKEKKHLPEIASAAEMRKEGVNIGELQIKLLQKIEELTLYSIEQNKMIEQMKNEIKMLKTKL
ncbi:hypothetical protein [Chryseobacterium sp. c4a]|uniref:hypothetical protein n=1 Tax=Chryseobacterium sp. c4a TaxID=1573582 RepID=UPI001624E112|nr:hypothetical protein [Chryseobacterium sp. c4a]